MGQKDNASRAGRPVKAPSDLRQAWGRSPDTAFDLIVRVEGNASERSAQLETRGVVIRRRHWLTPSLSIRCSGRIAVDLLEIEWIIRIEADKPVRALGGETPRR